MNWKEHVYGEMLRIANYPLKGFTIAQANEFATIYNALKKRMEPWFCDLLLIDAYPEALDTSSFEWGPFAGVHPQSEDDFLSGLLPLSKENFNFLAPIFLHKEEVSTNLMEKAMWCFAVENSAVKKFPRILKDEKKQPITRVRFSHPEEKLILDWVKNLPEFHSKVEQQEDKWSVSLSVTSRSITLESWTTTNMTRLTATESQKLRAKEILTETMSLFESLRIYILVDELPPGVNDLRDHLKGLNIFLYTSENLLHRVSSKEDWNLEDFFENTWRPLKALVIGWLFDKYPNLLRSIYDENIRTLETELTKLETCFLERDYGKIVIEAGNITQDLLSYLYFYIYKQKYPSEASIHAYMGSKVRDLIKTEFSTLTESDIEFIRNVRNPRAHSVMHRVNAQEARQALSRTRLFLDSFQVWLSERML